MLTGSSMTDSEDRRELEGRQACLQGPMAACTLHSPPALGFYTLYKADFTFFLTVRAPPRPLGPKMGAFASSRNHFRSSFSTFKGLGGLSPASKGGREQMRSWWLWRGWCLLFLRLL